MRFVSLALFLAASVFAQDTPEAQPQAPKKKVVIAPADRARLFETLRGAAPAASRVCAIPLLNVAPPNAQAIDPGMILPAPATSHAFAILQISPPAPPCDDVKR
jgi:hypothetical protein